MEPLNAMVDAADDMLRVLNEMYRIKPTMADDEVYDALPTSRLAVAYFNLADAMLAARGAQ